MKSLNYTHLICGIALLLSACGDTDSSTTSIDSANVTEADSLAEATTESKQSTSISIPSASEQEAAEPVDVSAIADDPIIRFENDSISVENDNGCITYKERVVNIYCQGNYQLTGSSSDNQVIVNAESTDKVYLYLNELQLASATDAPLYVQNAEKVFLMLVDGTKNTLADASTRTQAFAKENGTSDTTKATVYAKDDLTIKGSGDLTVTGNYSNGIQCSNDLRIRDLPGITVKAKNHAIKGKGSVTIEGGYFNLAATNGDGIKSDEGEDENTITENKGIVIITGGEFDIDAGDDGIQAFNAILIADSTSIPFITINSKGKGIATDNSLYINGGITNVTSADDGLHSNQNIYVNGGLTTISAGDDGIHADSTLRISDGAINITKAVEGIEAFYIRAEGGMTATVASDDAWNAAGGSADAGASSGSQWGGPGGGGGMMSSTKGYIIISGGYHYLYAAGNDVDVLDANGTATMSGGVLLLEIGTSGGNVMMKGPGGNGMGGNQGGSCSTNMAGGLIDTDNGFSITGGVLLGFGNRTEEYPNCSATSFTAGTAYGTSNAAFKPSASGSMIIYGGNINSVAQVDVSDMTEITLPNGMIYYEK
ncbi:carbohydrate-binding domain-containing protein [uncultured Fibrobacter sp.]|uniref:carbohydrate-binding domain-containing protein n=1 Tax=uncultured Fibrobacter sp. TaxID=261512 RepID=UPI00261110F1|nr:carbohydrate-binding domain-containing protein [uncultured Fibrobacter sp.]